MYTKSKRFCVLVVAIIILATTITLALILSPTAFANTLETYTGDFIGYSGDNGVSNADMFSGSNTYNYVGGDSSVKERYLYGNMTAKNSNAVCNDAPMITVFTHGYSSDASHWSNNGTTTGVAARFAYDAASAIKKVVDKSVAHASGANQFWAVCDGNSFRLIDLNVQPTNENYKPDINQKTIPRITNTELAKHMIIVFEASTAASSASNNVVYDELNFMLSKIAYDVRNLTGYLPKINLIGHSRGGLTNLQYTLDHPDMVSSLISVGTPYSGGNMLQNDDVLGILGMDPTNAGIADIKDVSLQNHYRNRWNNNHGKGLNLYNNISAHALGGYSELSFLKSVIDASGSLIGESEKAGLKAVIDFWFAKDLIVGVGVLLGQIPPEVKDIINVLATSVGVEYETFLWIFKRAVYMFYDDLVIDLDSQLATGYTGFIQNSKQFNDTSLFNKRSTWTSPPVVHNLETYSPWFTEYVKNNISVGNMYSNTITFDKQGGTGGTNSQQVYFNESLPSVSVPTRTGYWFRGYFTGTNGIGVQYYYSDGTKVRNWDKTSTTTLYAHWERITYTFRIYTALEENGVYSMPGKLHATVTFDYSDNLTYTAPEISGYNFVEWEYEINGIGGNTAFATLPTKTITLTTAFLRKYTAKYKIASCVNEGTLITLADGTQKAVESLTGEEHLLVWNLLTGDFDIAPILFIDSDPARMYEIIHLYFSDGTEMKVISEHAFWDFDLNQYIFLRSDATQYIGHWFNKQTTDSGGQLAWTKVQLVNVEIYEEFTTAWSPITFGHLCYYVNGMLSMPGATTGLINIFEVDSETMTINQEAFLSDIEEFGLFTYEEFAEIFPVPEIIFEAFGGQYLKISIGKDLITLEQLGNLSESYAKFFL